MYGGRLYIFAPGESMELPDHVADHALRYVNTGLVKMTAGDTPVNETDYGSVPWRKLVAMACERGVIKPGEKGNTKEKVVELMRVYDAQRRTI